jgi:acetolactate synthase-1/2/3 large subunit
MILHGAELTIKLLERQGIKTIIGIPGGANLPLYDALYNSKIQHILSRHEQGAAFMAQGIARATGKAAVCFATSGPGATNLITAIADAKLDSVPIVAITGQVAHSLIGTDAFQEVDTYGLTIPITKHNFLIRSIEELLTVIPEAFKIAEEGRPGPVLIDIPKDIQLAEIDISSWPRVNEPIESIDNLDTALIKEISEKINTAKKPVLYIGGGIISAKATKILKEFAEKNSIPVAVTLMGLGAFPSNHPLYLSMIGMHAARFTNYLMNECDVLLAFGVRFDDRAIGDMCKFCPNAHIIHIDIDNSEINKIKPVNLSISGNIKNVLSTLIDYIDDNPRKEWIDYVNETKQKHPFVIPSKETILHPINIIRFISSIVSEDSIIATDVGQHQMWVAQSYPFNHPRTLLTSGGLGTMGFGLPSAIGAAIAFPEKTIICFSGDGSILMNIQELATLADLNLNVKIIILNNKHLGLVRQQQELFYQKHYIASKFITNPDFAAISNGFGVNGIDLGKENNPMEALKNEILKPGPSLINIPIKEEENVYPMVPPGKSNVEMIGGEYNVK